MFTKLTAFFRLQTAKQLISSSALCNFINLPLIKTANKQEKMLNKEQPSREALIPETRKKTAFHSAKNPKPHDQKRKGKQRKKTAITDNRKF